MTILAAFGGVAIVVSAAWATGMAWSHGRAGRGYAAPVWSDSAIGRTGSRLPAAAEVWSNDAMAAVFVADRESARWFDDGPGSGPAALGRAACTSAVYVVWFDAAGNAARRLDGLGRVRRFRDGTVVEVACAD